MSASKKKKDRGSLPENPVVAAKKKELERVERRKNRIYNVAAIVLAVTLLAAVGLAIYQGVVVPNMPAATIGGKAVHAHEINYYYSNAYSNFVSSYGDSISLVGLDTAQSLRTQAYFGDENKTWHNYFTESALETIRQVRVLSEIARDAGLTLTDDDRAEITESIEAFRTDVAENTELTFAQYLEAVYGARMTEAEYERILEDSHLAQQYMTETIDNYNFTEDEMSAYYDENSAEFDLYTFRYYHVAAETNDEMTDEEKQAANDAALEKAQAIADASTDEDAFIAQVVADYVPAEGEEDIEYTEINADADTLVYEYSTEYLNYYFSADIVSWLKEDRAENDVTAISADGGANVVFFNERKRQDRETVDVRHILISYEHDDEGEEGHDHDAAFTDEQKEAARIQSDEIFAEWQAGDATEDSFAALAGEYSTDPGSKDIGGLYENVYFGQMTTNFNLWCFANDRKPGDTGIVETEYGYHIMYYVAQGEPYWQVQVDEDMREKNYTDWQKTELDKYEIVQKNERGVGLYNDR